MSIFMLLLRPDYGVIVIFGVVKRELIIDPLILHIPFYLSVRLNIKRFDRNILNNVYSFLVAYLVYRLLGTPVDIQVICAVSPPARYLFLFVKESRREGIYVYTHIFQVNADSLMPADQYSCKLVGVLSLI